MRRLLPPMVLAATLMAATPAFAADGLFGFVELKANRISSIPKWVDVLAKIEAQRVSLDACQRNVEDCSGAGARRWNRLLREQAGKPQAVQLAAVNSFFNSWKYINDNDLYGVSDKWATPREFMLKSGDCEDYAIAKYYTLRQLGWPEDRLRLVVVHDAVRDIPHAVLAAELSGKQMILDNLAREPLPDSYVMQYTPYYAVNAKARWVFLPAVTP